MARRGSRGCSAGRRIAAAGRVVAVVISAGATHAFAATQHLHLIYANLGAVAVLPALLVGPFAGADAAFHINLRAFAQVLPGNFGQAAVEHQAVPFGVLFGLASLLVAPFVGRGQRNIGYLIAAGERAHFRVSSQIADKNDFIN